MLSACRKVEVSETGDRQLSQEMDAQLRLLSLNAEGQRYGGRGSDGDRTAPETWRRNRPRGIIPLEKGKGKAESKSAPGFRVQQAYRVPLTELRVLKEGNTFGE